jgi:hypothetical protein
MQAEADKLIDEYKALVKEATGAEPNDKIIYVKGFIEFRHTQGFYERIKMVATLEDVRTMIVNLREALNNG